MTTVDAQFFEKKEMISDLLTQYVMVVDDKNRLSEWPDFFADNGAYYVYTKENYEFGLPMAIVMDDNKGRILDRVRAIQLIWKDHFDDLIPCHTISTPSLRFVDDTYAELTTNFTVSIVKLDKGPYVFSGRYLDKIVVTHDRKAKFIEKKVILDNPVLPTYLVYPL